jgi:hypothetical protein
MTPQPVEDPSSPHHWAGIAAVDEHGKQRAILNASPGMRLPESTNPLIVLKNGKPVLASVAIGSALHDVTLENLINVLDFGMDPQTAVNQPNTQGPFGGVNLNAPGKPEFEKEAIGEGGVFAIRDRRRAGSGPAGQARRKPCSSRLLDWNPDRSPDSPA